MPHRFEGKVAIVTGGARGQGERIVRTLAREGCSVVIGDVLDDLAKTVADDLGDSVVHTHLDVTSPEDWAVTVALATSAFGGLDVLVNNAAIYRKQLLEDETVADLDKVLAVNLRGPFLGIQSVAPAMRARGGGSIVNVSSLAGTTSYAGHGSYSMSKWALRGLTRTAAIELEPSKIRVNAVLPGNLRTDMSPTTGSPEAPTGLKRQADPQETANVVVFLASDDASFVNGTDIVADGGSLLG
ncbi:3alpha(or 20beta)-hydroxysteroid dehydrogenase [Rhodococcus rhodochrous J3]|uniref:3alpha(Or 20beta)-hydroxysteroid dehydrogenase n=1 Tax=Rhodococcus rhodochrous J3 TaxID=903528 RepID=A0ABY1MH40_RHORH|nr:glucose 1-dehydrogenase [Rhodococcus rhodochrous]MBF4478867.1 glucose 1-dehydrogenase [Rhodococcus rhodochrous]MCD2097486.1 glucose 1-dehydrogenase [Rhodococcus rhodochrous]MCD2122598.1 glucose 1-dehydrogenase [Rhodococcus rhodochrous]MCQ4133598.1 glucose 1-dehydrogenase [Rhodococcus rhodochrous]MDJ0018102.1 glucose 1-dehydrogenase [Rhodococcus rhodochrous]